MGGHFKWLRNPDGTRKLDETGHGILIPAEQEQPAELHYVHQDTMPPLRHPVTSETIDSRTKWKQINREHNLLEVGNDLISKRPREIKDRITEERIYQAFEKSEAILSDPARRNSYRNEQAMLRERNQRLLNGCKR